MSDRFQDPNWGKHGNPNRENWYHYSQGRSELPIIFDHRDKNKYIFAEKPLHISPWTMCFIILGIFVLSGFSETARGVIFYGINLTETWYHSVDVMLDALGAPKLP